VKIVCLYHKGKNDNDGCQMEYAMKAFRSKGFVDKCGYFLWICLLKCPATSVLVELKFVGR